MRKLLLALLVLLVLLVAADFGARAYAESRTADAVQAELRASTAPDVSIEGFPFLWHAARGHYPQVIVTAADVAGSSLAGTRAVLELSDVALPLRDALADDASKLTAQASSVEVLVPLASLSAALGRTDVRLSAAADGSLQVSTTVTVLGRQIPLTGTADVTIADDTLTLSVGSLSAAGLDVTPLISAAANALALDLKRSFPLSGLPFTITRADVAVAGTDLVVTGHTGPVALADLR